MSVRLFTGHLLGACAVLHPGSEGHSTLTPPWARAGTLCLLKTPGVRLIQASLPPGSERDLNILYMGTQAPSHCIPGASQVPPCGVPGPLQPPRPHAGVPTGAWTLCRLSLRGADAWEGGRESASPPLGSRFSIIPSQEIPGLISFRMDCLGRPVHPSAASAERGAGEAPRWEGACFRGQEGLQLSEGWGGQTARPQSCLN